MRVPSQVHEAGDCPLGHSSLDASTNGEPFLLDQLASPEQEAAGPADDLALEQLVDQLPAAQITALRLTILEVLSLRQAAEQLQGGFDSTLKPLLALLGGASVDADATGNAWEREGCLPRASPV